MVFLLDTYAEELTMISPEFSLTNDQLFLYLLNKIGKEHEYLRMKLAENHAMDYEEAKRTIMLQVTVASRDGDDRSVREITSSQAMLARSPSFSFG